MPEKFKKDFAEKQITCGSLYCLYRFKMAWTYLYIYIYIYSVEYVGLTPGYEREIFQRVQLGMTLTAAGKFARYFVNSQSS